MYSREHLTRDLRSLGVHAGDTLMLHASVRAVGEIAGGPDEIHLAVKDALTPDGTLLMYAGCPQYVDEIGRGNLTAEQEAELLAKLPPFDARTARSARDHGVLVEFLRTYPGSRVNPHPARFVAWGRRAESLFAKQPWDFAFGLDSALDRFHDTDGKILLLGCDHDAVTFLHYVEHVADFPGKRTARFRVPVLEHGQRVWREMAEYDTSGDGVHPNWPSDFFRQIVDDFLDATHNAGAMVGSARSHLLSARALFAYAEPVMKRVASVAVVFLSLLGSCARPDVARDDWRVTGGDAGNTRYSVLDQIDRDNVGRLRVAWTYHTGDLTATTHGEIQATPIVIDGVMYTTTPALAVIALRADSGTLLWRFDPFARRARVSHVSRGVAYWAEKSDRRIFFTAGRRLYGLDAGTGAPVLSFGDSGSVDLGAGLSRDVSGDYLVATSPGVVYRDLLIQGTRVGEGARSAPGDVRAYDVRTGAIRWTFHAIPRPGEAGYDTWPADAWRTAGGANSWAGMAVDVKRGVVYVPTGSATPDFYGGDRAGANLFANTLVALDAATGRRLWHFQTVHHDIWDRDLPAAPNLVTVRHNGTRIDAVAQIAKSGFVFLFDRVSGTPLFPIEERPVPASELVGEQAWPTQPFPTRPAPFARQSMTEADVADITPGAHDAALARLRALRAGPLYTPPSEQGSIVLPGFDGGGEWGGAAVDPESATLYVNASDVPWIAAMRKSASTAPRVFAAKGADVYAKYCASCHGVDRRGHDRAPGLVGVAARITRQEAQLVLRQGRGFMPSFATLRAGEQDAVLGYLGYTASRPRAAVSTPSAPSRTTPAYEFVGYERWRDTAGLPAIRPPWGTLSAIDLNTGEYVWRVTLGEHAALSARGIPPTGTEQYGGPILTRGGVLFIGATQDSMLRAFDARSGRLLWHARLPAPAFATPSTYAVRGKQYVVVAAGGGKLGAPSSDVYVAFALP